MMYLFSMGPRQNRSRLAPGPLLLLVMALLPALLPAQEPDTLALVQRLPRTARFAAADHLGNIYLICSDNQIEKYNGAGVLLTRFSNNQLGRAAALDVSNPLKSLVWYADFRTAVFLDRSLTPLGTLNLIDAGYPEVRTLCMARDGNLWIYDEVNFKLRKIQPDGSQLYESQALNMLLPDRMNITLLQDDGNRVYAIDPALGMLLFDVYGQFQKLRRLPGITHLFADGKRLEYIADGRLFVEMVEEVEKVEMVEGGTGIPLPADRTGAPSWLSGGKWMVLNGNATEVFRKAEREKGRE